MSVFEETWAEALSCALTGRPSHLPMPEEFPAVPARPEDGLLYRIVALGTYGLAGALPDASGFKARSPAEDDACPLAAAALLPSLMREPSDFPLARQWVSEAERLGLSVPLECAKALVEAYLTRGLPIPEGPFAKWMAWRGKGAEDASALFQTATGAERLRVLRSWRRGDAEAAREGLAATLADESASTRAGLVSCLEEGLSDADAEFLQGLLTDRSSEVRAAVAGVLVGLPGSELVRSLSAKARDHVLRDARGRVEVSVPNEGLLGESWLEAQGIAVGGGASQRLCALVGSVPLATWDGMAPAEWIAATARLRWYEELWSGWAIAARREGDRAWGVALGRGLRDMMGKGFAQSLAPVVLGALSPDDWESMATVLLHGCDLEGSMRILSASPHAAWSDAFTHALVPHLARVGESHARDRWAARISLDPVALAADPSCAERFRGVAERWESEWMTALKEQFLSLVATLERRRAIAESFAGP